MDAEKTSPVAPDTTAATASRWMCACSLSSQPASCWLAYCLVLVGPRAHEDVGPQILTSHRPNSQLLDCPPPHRRDGGSFEQTIQEMAGALLWLEYASHLRKPVAGSTLLNSAKEAP